MRCANRLRSEHADIKWDVSEVKEMRYSIPEINMESLEKKLTRIGNKCRKYGCEFKFCNKRQTGRMIYEILSNGEVSTK